MIKAWNEQGATLLIIVNKPWWRTTLGLYNLRAALYCAGLLQLTVIYAAGWYKRKGKETMSVN